MRTLDRLVAGQFLKLFLLALLATPPLFALGEFTEKLEVYAERGLGGMTILVGHLYRLPEYIVWAFPIAGLVAAIFTVHTMTAHREIVAAKAGGISFHRVVLPIVLVGALLTGVAVALTEVVPRTNRIAFATLEDRDLRREFRNDFVHTTEGGYTLSARRLTLMDSRMEGVALFRAPAEELPGVHIKGAEAEYLPDEGWTLLNGRLTTVRADGSVFDQTFTRLRVPALTEQPGELLDEPPEPDEMTYAELKRSTEILERSGGRFAPTQVKMYQRIAIPAATLVIILFGVPLATSSNRGGTAYGIGAGLGTTILYLLLFKIAGGFGESGQVPAYLAAWAPNGMFLLAGLVLMVKVRT